MPFAANRIRPLAVAVVRYEGKVLAVRGVDRVKNQEFFRLPGGGIEFGETAEQTLQREFAEEFGVEIKVGRRLGVAENIFCYEGKNGHEIVFVFEAFLADEKLYSPAGLPFVEPGMEDPVARWVAMTPETRLYPEAVRQLNF